MDPTGWGGLSVQVQRVAAPVREQVLEQLRTAIVEALEARDGERAAAACVHHVNEAARTVLAAMTNALGDHEETHNR